MVSGKRPLNIFEKSSIIDVSLGSKYATERVQIIVSVKLSKFMTVTLPIAFRIFIVIATERYPGK